MYWLGIKRQIEGTLNRELSKKKHPWAFKNLTMRILEKEEELSVNFVDSIMNLIKEQIEGHEDICHSE